MFGILSMEREIDLIEKWLQIERQRFKKNN